MFSTELARGLFAGSACCHGHSTGDEQWDRDTAKAHTNQTRIRIPGPAFPDPTESLGFPVPRPFNRSRTFPGSNTVQRWKSTFQKNHGLHFFLHTKREVGTLAEYSTFGFVTMIHMIQAIQASSKASSRSILNLTILWISPVKRELSLAPTTSSLTEPNAIPIKSVLYYLHNSVTPY
jgi:hypothetical protein